MRSLFKSKKGVETAPLFLIFSAFVLVLTAAIVFPAMTEWEKTINKGKAIKETIKLRNAINEIHAMSDIGSVEQVSVSLPPGYEIQVNPGSLVLKNSDEGVEEEFYLNAEVDSEVKNIKGNTRVTVAFWDKESKTSSEGIIIWVYNQ